MTVRERGIAERAELAGSPSRTTAAGRRGGQLRAGVRMVPGMKRKLLVYAKQDTATGIWTIDCPELFIIGEQAAAVSAKLCLPPTLTSWRFGT